MVRQADVKMSRYNLKFKRRREGKTDYRTRLALLKSDTPRAVVRVSNSQTVVQIVTYEPSGDIIKTQAHGSELEKFGWKASGKNTPASYLVGYLAGLRAKNLGIGECVLDLGMASTVRGSRVFAALKGLIDAGLDIPHDDDALPADERIAGEHIEALGSIDDVKASVSKSILPQEGS